ncbi:hypothetical protein PR048_031662 [Dryococelus australis]|uniref:Uncharacterized protein n=1 Tax=Dryococelus australis TaxID=614101 RepID=A0ABQ9G6X6_9NEOP|nr:hypothetical protein PR048_031662 [Dryococelus australis]
MGMQLLPFAVGCLGGVVVRLFASHLGDPGPISGVFASGFSPVFLGDPPFLDIRHCDADTSASQWRISKNLHIVIHPHCIIHSKIRSPVSPPFHSGAAPYSPRFILIGSQDLGVKGSSEGGGPSIGPSEVKVLDIFDGLTDIKNSSPAIGRISRDCLMDGRLSFVAQKETRMIDAIRLNFRRIPESLQNKKVSGSRHVESCEFHELFLDLNNGLPGFREEFGALTHTVSCSRLQLIAWNICNTQGMRVLRSVYIALRGSELSIFNINLGIAGNVANSDSQFFTASKVTLKLIAWDVANSDSQFFTAGKVTVKLIAWDVANSDSQFFTAGKVTLKLIAWDVANSDSQFFTAGKVTLKLIAWDVANSDSQFFTAGKVTLKLVAWDVANSDSQFFTAGKVTVKLTLSSCASHGENTVRPARRSDEALGVRVNVARIAPSLLDLERGAPTGTRNSMFVSLGRRKWHVRGWLTVFRIPLDYRFGRCLPLAETSRPFVHVPVIWASSSSPSHDAILRVEAKDISYTIAAAASQRIVSNEQASDRPANRVSVTKKVSRHDNSFCGASVTRGALGNTINIVTSLRAGRGVGVNEWLGRDVCDCEYQTVKGVAGRLDYWTRCLTVLLLLRSYLSNHTLPTPSRYIGLLGNDMFVFLAFYVGRIYLAAISSFALLLPSTTVLDNIFKRTSTAYVSILRALKFIRLLKVRLNLLMHKFSAWSNDGMKGLGKRENPEKAHRNGIVLHYSHLRKSRASRLTAQPSRPPKAVCKYRSLASDSHTCASGEVPAIFSDSSRKSRLCDLLLLVTFGCRQRKCITSPFGVHSIQHPHSLETYLEVYRDVLEVAAIDLEAGVQTTPKVVKGTGEDMLRDGIDSCNNVGLEFLECVRSVNLYRPRSAVYSVVVFVTDAAITEYLLLQRRNSCLYREPLPSSRTRQKNVVTVERHVGTQFANQRLETLSPPRNAANGKLFRARSSQSDARPIPTTSEASIEQHRNKRAGEIGDTRENPLNGIVRHNSHSPRMGGESSNHCTTTVLRISSSNLIDNIFERENLTAFRMYLVWRQTGEAANEQVTHARVYKVLWNLACSQARSQNFRTSRHTACKQHALLRKGKWFMTQRMFQQPNPNTQRPLYIQRPSWETKLPFNKTLLQAAACDKIQKYAYFHDVVYYEPIKIFVSYLISISHFGTKIDESEIQNHEISLGQHFYIGTKIKLDPGSELGPFDLGSGKILLQPCIRGSRKQDSSCGLTRTSREELNTVIVEAKQSFHLYISTIPQMFGRDVVGRHVESVLVCHPVATTFAHGFEKSIGGEVRFISEIGDVSYNDTETTYRSLHVYALREWQEHIHGTGRGGAVFTHWTRIREDPGSISGPAILISGFHGFPKSLQENAGLGPKQRPWSISSLIPLPCATCTVSNDLGVDETLSQHALHIHGTYNGLNTLEREVTVEAVRQIVNKRHVHQVTSGVAVVKLGSLPCGRSFEILIRVILVASQRLQGHGGIIVRILTFHLDEPVLIPGGVSPRFSHVGIVPYDAAEAQRASKAPLIIYVTALARHLALRPDEVQRDAAIREKYSGFQGQGTAGYLTEPMSECTVDKRERLAAEGRKYGRESAGNRVSKQAKLFANDPSPPAHKHVDGVVRHPPQGDEYRVTRSLHLAPQITAVFQPQCVHARRAVNNTQYSSAGKKGGGGNTGDSRENPSTNGIVRHVPTCENPGVTRPAIEPGSPWWEASRLTTQPPQSRDGIFCAEGKSASSRKLLMVCRNHNSEGECRRALHVRFFIRRKSRLLLGDGLRMAPRTLADVTNKASNSTVKSVHDKVSTIEMNLRNKSLPLYAYILMVALSDIRLVKLVTVD